MKKLLTFYAILLLCSCNEFIDGFKSTENEANIANKVITKYASGEKLSETYYVDGLKQGVGKRFYRSGGVSMEVNYEKGKKHGDGKYYYEDGKLYRLNRYVNDTLHGEQIKYRGDGQIMSKQLYHEGHPGIHLEEFNRKGVKRVRYPKVISSFHKDRPSKGYYTIQFQFEEGHHKDEFFIGRLLNDQFLHDGLKPLQETAGVAVFVNKWPEEVTEIEFSMEVIGVKYTDYKNKYVVRHRFNYSNP